MVRYSLDGTTFAKMAIGGAKCLHSNKTIVNDLNVFPVPDGDTGDNMYMTLKSGCSEIADFESVGICDVSSFLAKGMLMGARGNSGVILSRIFAGISEGLSDMEVADVNDISKAFLCGVDRAYESVSTAVEGTILTVYREACEYAQSRISNKSTVDTYFSDYFDELKRSLERTPKLLPVLSEAGVVDSGGAGLVYITEGMINALEGGLTDYSLDDNSVTVKTDYSKFNENSTLDYGYCTEFLLQLLVSKCDVKKFDVEAFTEYLNLFGDSVVCFMEGSVLKVHVHTKTPGMVLDRAQKYGEFLTLKIENMTLQHNESNIQNRYVVPKSTKRKPFGIVTVAAGKGISDMFIEAGADVVVEGGQCMNPSVGDLIDAFKKINAENIIVLPNNSNVILTAKTACQMYQDSEIFVVESKTVGDGYAAMGMFDPGCNSVDEILENFACAMEDVKTATVCRAIRNSSVSGVDVKEGDYIGICDDEILSASVDINEAVLSLCEKLTPEKDLILLCYGESVSEDEAQVLRNLLEKKLQNIEVALVNGGQPVYDYLLIIE